MKTREDLVEVATRLAELLRSDMEFVVGTMGSGSHWRASPPTEREKIRARGTTGLEFLRMHAGSGSEWYRRAKSMIDDAEGRSTAEERVRFVADVLAEWASQVEAGITEPAGLATAGATEIASTDLMDQVRALNADKGVIPAVPIVLAGAALEVALRAVVEAAHLQVTGSGSISAYGKALRGADLISKQDMKDIEAVAGLRNAAAHGEHGELSRERAGLMEQQVNMMLARITDL